MIIVSKKSYENLLKECKKYIIDISDLNSDSDSDSFSVEIDTDLEGVTYDESQGRLNIDAQMVDADLSDSVTITATDNEGASNSATLTVNITNSSNAPPTVSWVGFQEEPDFIVRERTTLRLPFEVQDADNDSFDYNIEFIGKGNTKQKR